MPTDPAPSSQTTRPVVAATAWGLHALVLGLTALVIVRAWVGPAATPTSGPGLVRAVAGSFLAVYLVGAVGSIRFARGTAAPGHTGHAHRARRWLAVLTLVWVVLVVCAPDAAYLVFPLFFLQLHLLGPRHGEFAVALTAVVAVRALAIHRDLTLGGVVGHWWRRCWPSSWGRDTGPCCGRRANARRS